MTAKEKIAQAKIAQAKDFLREPFAWPGGYTKTLYLEDGEPICRDCTLEAWKDIVEATKDTRFRTGWGIMTVDIHWEGPSEFCCHCNKEMPSVYGDPWCAECNAVKEDNDDLLCGKCAAKQGEEHR